MAKKDPRVDAYIGKAEPFAKPILKHLRKIVHAGCPDVEETIKWGFPFFEYKGVMCFMSGFKNHCTFGFWKGSLVFGSSKAKEEAMEQFGRITSLKDLSSEKILIDYVRRAAALNEKGVKVPRPARSTRKKALVIPDDLKAALRGNKKAQKTFENFSYTNKKEYVEWITGAKRGETRRKRLKTAIDWMAQGKVHNWKYLPKRH